MVIFWQLGSVKQNVDLTVCWAVSITRHGRYRCKYDLVLLELHGSHRIINTQIILVHQGEFIKEICTVFDKSTEEDYLPQLGGVEHAF